MPGSLMGCSGPQEAGERNSPQSWPPGAPDKSGKTFWPKSPEGSLILCQPSRAPCLTSALLEPCTTSCPAKHTLHPTWWHPDSALDPESKGTCPLQGPQYPSEGWEVPYLSHYLCVSELGWDPTTLGTSVSLFH